MANSVDIDQTQHSVASDLGLHCLQRLICPNTKGYYGNGFFLASHILFLHTNDFIMKQTYLYSLLLHII